MFPSDCLLLVLMRFRLNLGLQDLAYRFGISLSRANEIFKAWIDMMFVSLRHLIVWPSQEIAYIRDNVILRVEDRHFRLLDIDR